MALLTRYCLLLLLTILIGSLGFEMLPAAPAQANSFGANVYPLIVPWTLNEQIHQQYTEDGASVATPWPDGPTRHWSATNNLFRLPFMEYGVQNAPYNVETWNFAGGNILTSDALDQTMSYPGIYHPGPIDGSPCPAADIGCYHELTPPGPPTAEQQDNRLTSDDWVEMSDGIKRGLDDRLSEHVSNLNTLILPMFDSITTVDSRIHAHIAEIGAFKILGYNLHGGYRYITLKYLGPAVPEPLAPTSTLTATATHTPTATNTPTATSTPTSSPAATATGTPTPAATSSPTATRTPTATVAPVVARAFLPAAQR